MLDEPWVKFPIQYFHQCFRQQRLAQENEKTWPDQQKDNDEDKHNDNDKDNDNDNDKYI